MGFLRAVVEKVRKDACIDRKRVYASGLSGGGLMSYRLAREAADVFAAIAPVSGATVFAPCQPSAQGPVRKSHSIGETNTQCAGNSHVTLCSVHGGHVLYGDAAKAGAAVPDVAWQIFERHSLP